MSYSHDVNSESTEAAGSAPQQLRRSLRLRQQGCRRVGVVGDSAVDAAAAAVVAFVGTCNKRRSRVAPVVVAAADTANAVDNNDFSTNDTTVVEPPPPAVRRSYRLRLRLRSAFHNPSMEGLSTAAASTPEELKEPIGGGAAAAVHRCPLRRRISTRSQESAVVVIPGEQAEVSTSAVEGSELSPTGCDSIHANVETSPVPVVTEDDNRKLPALVAMAPALATAGGGGAIADDDGDGSDYDDLPQLDDVEPVAAGRKAPPGVFTADSGELGSSTPGWLSLSWSPSKVQVMIELPAPCEPEFVSRIPTREEIQAIVRSPEWREGIAEARRARLRRRPGTLYPGAPVPRQVRRGV